MTVPSPAHSPRSPIGRIGQEFRQMPIWARVVLVVGAVGIAAGPVLAISWDSTSSTDPGHPAAMNPGDYRLRGTVVSSNIEHISVPDPQGRPGVPPTVVSVEMVEATTAAGQTKILLTPAATTKDITGPLQLHRGQSYDFLMSQLNGVWMARSYTPAG